MMIGTTNDEIMSQEGEMSDKKTRTLRRDPERKDANLRLLMVPIVRPCSNEKYQFYK
jgi:hypothetical protein